MKTEHLISLLAAALPYVRSYAGSPGAAAIGDAGYARELAGRIAGICGENPPLSMNAERAAGLLHAIGNSMESVIGEGVTVCHSSIQNWKEGVDVAALLLDRPRGE